jgi:predicted lipid-binding transport protein (Tim44 family)
VGKELLSLLERAPPPKQSPRVTTKPSPDLPGSVSGGGGGMAAGGGMGGGMPGMVGGGMMGMGEASPFFMVSWQYSTCT